MSVDSVHDSSDISDDQLYDSDSPVTMDDDSGSEFEISQIKLDLEEGGASPVVNNELDIIITYIKGQAHIYSKSQSVTQQKIYALTVPSFIFSAAVVVLAPLIHTYEWSGILISALTASIAALFGCVRFYELDAAATNYLYLANQYMRMQISLETISNSRVINRDTGYSREVADKIRDTENRMTELREYPCLPPAEVATLIPIISHINIFSFIKKMEILRQATSDRLAEVKNEIRFIDNKMNSFHTKQMSGIVPIEIGKENADPPHWKRERKRMAHLLEVKRKLRQEMSYYTTSYTYLDEIFTREINQADRVNMWTFMIFGWTCISESPHTANPVVDKHIQQIRV